MLYHLVPHNLIGKTLYPLNQLADIHPEIAASHAKKYEGREQLMTQTIPLLNCLWNSALHLSPIHPSKVKSAYVEAGGKWYPFSYYCIPEQLLDSDKAVVHTVYPKTTHDMSATEGTTKWLKDVYIDDLREVPTATRDYYESTFTAGNLPLVFAYTPHVLYQGAISIEDLAVAVES
jgi:hypothetical protein